MTEGADRRWTAGPVVVIPGLCVSSYLRPFCSALAARGAEVVLLDPPGWPRTPKPAVEPTSLAEVAATLVTTLAVEGVRDAVLVGQSVGAQLAAHVAVAAPDRVRLLVLQGPTVDPRWRAVWPMGRRWLRDLPREHPALLAREVPEWVSVGPRRIAHTLDMALADELETTVAAYAGDVAVLVGEHDPFGTAEWWLRLASRPDLCRLMPGLPHSAPHRAPDAVADALQTLVAAAAAGPGLNDADAAARPGLNDADAAARQGPRAPEAAARRRPGDAAG